MLFVMPWPLASNRIWIEGGWLAIVALLTVAQLWRAPAILQRGQAFGVPHGMRLHMGLLAAWAAWIGLQLVPVPAFVHALLEHSRIPGFPVEHAAFAPLSLDPYSTRAYLARAVLMLFIQWLLLRVFDNRLRLAKLVWVWLAAGVVEATLGVVLFAAGASYTLFFTHVDQGLRARGTFVYQNHFAGYMELMLALGIGWMIALLGRAPPAGGRTPLLRAVQGFARFFASSKAPLRVFLIVFVIALIASRSRMGNAAFFMSLWLVGGATLVALRRRGEVAVDVARVVAVFMISILVLDVLIIGDVVGIDRVVQRLDETHLRNAGPGVHDREQTVEQRVAPGERALRMLEDFPIAGVGGGTFFLAYLPYKPRDVTGFYDHAHNDFVEFGVESGLIGLVLLGALLGWSQWRGWNLLLRSNSSALERGLAFASVMGVTEILIHSTVDFNLQNPTNGVLFLWLLALPHWIEARRARHGISRVRARFDLR